MRWVSIELLLQQLLRPLITALCYIGKRKQRLQHVFQIVSKARSGFINRLQTRDVTQALPTLLCR